VSDLRGSMSGEVTRFSTANTTPSAYEPIVSIHVSIPPHHCFPL
jgi:hypothetical protein